MSSVNCRPSVRRHHVTANARPLATPGRAFTMVLRSDWRLRRLRSAAGRTCVHFSTASAAPRLARSNRCRPPPPSSHPHSPSDGRPASPDPFVPRPRCFFKPTQPTDASPPQQRWQLGRGTGTAPTQQQHQRVQSTIARPTPRPEGLPPTHPAAA
jgi:hypothetical protein